LPIFRFWLRTICENSLAGDLLQLNIIIFSSRQCVAQKGKMCKIQLEEQLKNMFSRMLIIPVRIQFHDNRFKSIDIKICSRTETTGKAKSTASEESYCHLLRRRRRRRRNSYNSNKNEKSANNSRIDHNANTKYKKE